MIYEYYFSIAHSLGFANGTFDSDKEISSRDDIEEVMEDLEKTHKRFNSIVLLNFKLLRTIDEEDDHKIILQQSKLSSLIESIFNVIIGAVVALISQILVFPIYDIHVSLQTNLWIMAWFTFISVIRSYLIRRFFNAKLKEAAEKLARK